MDWFDRVYQGRIVQVRLHSGLVGWAVRAWYVDGDAFIRFVGLQGAQDIYLASAVKETI